MYVPAHFAETDRAVLLQFLVDHPLGTLVTASPTQGLYATHLPLVLDPSRGAFGVLQGHVARANPHHRKASDTTDALVIFNGPESYITPSWYASKAKHGRVVPTWNYVAVHATGTVRFIDDAAFLLTHLTRLTNAHESDRAHPWSISDAPASYVEKLVGTIVGVEIEITALEGKWKVSQNRTDDDIDGVITGLSTSSDVADHVMAEHVAARRPKRDDSPAA